MSSRPSIVRVFEPIAGPGRRAELWVVVLNETGKEIVFSSDSLTATAQNGARVVVVPYAKLAAERRRDHKRRYLLAGLGNSLIVGSGTSGMRTADGRISGMVDGQIVSADVDITYYDPNLAAVQQREAQELITRNERALAERFALDLASLEENVQPTSLQNGDQMQAKFTIEWPDSVRRNGKDTPVTFVIHVGDDKHVLNAVVTDAY